MRLVPLCVVIVWMSLLRAEEVTRKKRSLVIPNEPESGTFTSWSQPTQCSRTCGGGISTVTRECLDIGYDLRPRCTGPVKMHTLCNQQSCPEGAKDFRLEQCEAFNNQPFDGVFHQWVPYMKAPDKCALNCMPKGERSYYRHKSRVIDGTPCNPETNAICIEGACTPVGCDGMLGSSVKEDVCRVCNGDGSTCKAFNGTFVETDLEIGYHDFLLIPAGATNIFIKEMERSNNYLAIRNTSGHYFLNGNWLIQFPQAIDAAGTVFHYERKPSFFSPESLRALGPTEEPLYIVLLYEEHNPGISFEFHLPKSMLEGAGQNETYDWKAEEFGDCEVECGESVRMRNVTCIRGSDGESVSENLCDLTTQPEKEENCTKETCPEGYVPTEKPEEEEQKEEGEEPDEGDGEKEGEEGKKEGKEGEQEEEKEKVPEWVMGEWNDCTEACGLLNETRSILCVDAEGKSVGDSSCEEKKPESMRACKAPTDCAYRWYMSEWSECSSKTAVGVQNRHVFCGSKTENGTVEEADNDNCKPPMPADAQNCTGEATAKPHWTIGNWSECSVTCGTGFKKRRVICVQWNDDGSFSKSIECDKNETPEAAMECVTDPCVEDGEVEGRSLKKKKKTKRIKKWNCYRGPRRPKEAIESSGEMEEVTTTPKGEMSTTPKEAMSTTPKEEMSTTPKEEMSTTPREEMSTTPKEEMSTTPKEEITTTPKEEMSTTPREEMTTTPKEEGTTTLEEGSTTPNPEMSTTPGTEMTTTPGTEMTTTPGTEMTTTPGTEMTTTPGTEMTTTPKEEMTTTPKEEMTTTPMEEVEELSGSSGDGDEDLGSGLEDYSGDGSGSGFEFSGAVGSGEYSGDFSGDGDDVGDLIYEAPVDDEDSETEVSTSSSTSTAATPTSTIPSSSTTESSTAPTSSTTSSSISIFEVTSDQPTTHCDDLPSGESEWEWVEVEVDDSEEEGSGDTVEERMLTSEGINGTTTETTVSSETTDRPDEKELTAADIPDINPASCALPDETGPGRNFTTMWFFDMEYGGCTRFWYGGTGGNENRFETEEICKRVCVSPTETDKICNLPDVKGPCDSYKVRWFFDPRYRQCRQFYYGGCLGNANNFERVEDCQRQCSDASQMMPIATPAPTTTTPRQPVLGYARIEEGDTGTIRCPMRGSKDITWTKGGYPVYMADGRIRQHDGDLIVYGARRDDAGVYSCYGTDAYGRTGKEDVTVDIESAAERPAQIVYGSSDTTVQLGSAASLACDVIGKPKPTVSWWKESELIPHRTAQFEVFQNNTLLIRSVRLRDLGPYTCQAFNGIGAASSHSVVLRGRGLTGQPSPDEMPYTRYVIDRPVLPERTTRPPWMTLAPGQDPDLNQIPLVAEGQKMNPSQVPLSCTDDYSLANCKLIVEVKYCSHQYYSRFCCRSCAIAGQLTLGQIRELTKKSPFRNPYQ